MLVYLLFVTMLFEKILLNRQRKYYIGKSLNEALNSNLQSGKKQ